MTFEEFTEKERHKKMCFEICSNVEYGQCTEIGKITERIMIERTKMVNSAILMEMQQIATEHGIDTTFFLNEKSIVSALEKQIPKKPIPQKDKIMGHIVSFTCPNCGGKDLGNNEYRFECCENCGQALDWSDTE